MDDGNKLGLGAAFAALLAGAAHFGDDLFRGAARLVSHERPVASVIGDVAPPAVEGAVSVVQGPGTSPGTESPAPPRLRFSLIVASSAGDLSLRRPGLVTFRDGRRIEIGSVRDPEARRWEIDLEDDRSLAGTPLAACRNPLPSGAQRDVRRCVDRALNRMAGLPAGSGAL